MILILRYDITGHWLRVVDLKIKAGKKVDKLKISPNPLPDLHSLQSMWTIQEKNSFIRIKTFAGSMLQQCHSHSGVGREGGGTGLFIL